MYTKHGSRVNSGVDVLDDGIMLKMILRQYT